MTAGDEAGGQPAAERRQTLTAAMRRDLLAEVAQELGSVVEGDRGIREAGDGVALTSKVEPDGTIVLTWWMTAMAPAGHPRWREAAATLCAADEAIYTSALGGGFLVEIEQRAPSVREAVRLARSSQPVERVRTLAAAFPEALGRLAPEAVPDYLLPKRDPS
ncbi:MAG TPA: hypothetical protein VMU89_05125 [Thermomicrobiaceae bacterium]|nr:hypothetical protein [Thermomicrobiaceae bacterium]